MKIKTNDELSLLHKYTFGIANDIGEGMGKVMIDLFKEKFEKDKKFHDLDYSGALSTILKANTTAFIRVLQFADFIGRQFPDVEHSSQEIFEEVLKGLRVLTSFKEPNEKEYINNIKKVTIQ